MSEQPMMSEQSAPVRLIQHGNITAVPSFHCRVAFALEVRRAFAEVQPDCVAVELAPALKPALLEGIGHLPNVRVVSYPEADGRRCYLAIDPCDSMIEAARLAVEHRLPLELVDLDVDNYRQKPSELPDPHAIGQIGLPAYYERVTAEFRRSQPGSKDYNRERFMAARLRELSERHQRVLFVLGMAHWGRIAGFLSTRSKDPIPTIPTRELTLANVTDASFEHILGELPYLTYLYEVWRQAQPIPLREPTPPISIREQAPPISFREPTPPISLQRQRPSPAAPAAPSPAAPAAPSPAAPQLAQRAPGTWDAGDALKHMMLEAETVAEREWGRRAGPGCMGTLLRFVRNWAVTGGRLLPGLFQMLVAGKNIVSEEYAGELYLLARHYPFNRPDPQLPTLDLRRNTGRMQLGSGTVRFRVRRELPVSTGQRVELPIRRPPTRGERQQYQEDWRRRDLGSSHVSHVPEDVALERFIDYVRQRAAEFLAARHTRTQEFTASLLDGLDLRETIRNWPVRQALYVREECPVRGKIGPVVVIFDEDGDRRRYPWQITWYSEFDYECDLALYATEPGASVVGPGISRCEYGGLASIVPAGKLRGNVWGDPAFARATTKSERLLMAAIDYARDPYIAYVGPTPPRAFLQSLAGRKGKRIVYVPPGALSDAAVARIRVFHVLQNRHVRATAHKYIRG